MPELPYMVYATIPDMIASEGDAVVKWYETTEEAEAFIRNYIGEHPTEEAFLLKECSFWKMRKGELVKADANLQGS